MNEPKFGASIPQENWIQRTRTTDPNPRIPFSSGIIGTDMEPVMSTAQAFVYSMVIGFAIGVILFVR